MEPSLHLHEFFVEGSNPEVSHVLLNITEPSTTAERGKGYFFAICEIDNATTKYIAKMQDIIDEIENSYYEIPDQVGQSSMEIVLDKINQDSLPMIQPEIALHCIVGAIREDDIIFSFHGHPQMVLFYKTKDGFYKKMDLVEQNKSNEPYDTAVETKKGQMFSQIVQGKIGSNDFFFAGTPHIIEYFNHDRLEKIITTRPPRQSSEHLQRVLSEIKNDLSFGGIIINLQTGVTTPAPIKSSPARKIGSARSLKSLFSTERNTAHILSPSFLPRFENKIDGASDKEETISAVMYEAADDASPNTEISSSHLRSRNAKTSMRAGKYGARQRAENMSLEDFVKKTFGVIWKILKYAARGLALLLLFIGAILSTLGKNFLLLFFIITNYKNRRHNILAEWARWWRNVKENIARLPLVTKILLSLSLILLLAFSGGIAYVGAKQKKEAHILAYAKALQNIKTKGYAAESFLVYNDTGAALASIQEAEQIIKELACLSASEKVTCQNLRNRLNGMLIKARKITPVYPQLLADWNGLMPTDQIDNIFLLNNKLYGFGQTSTNIASYDPLIKESKLIVPGISVKNFSAASVPKENDYAVLLYDNANIAQFKPTDNSWRKIDIDFPNQNAAIAGISIYNRRLYSLDTQNNQIYKHDAIKTGFALGKEWLKDNSADIKTGMDLAVDGDVFALGKNGSVYKFTNGLAEPFAITGLDPQLTSADEIWTYNDLNYIYILDTAGKRIIVLEKTGELKKQITAKEFTNPTGMIIEEQKGVAYVLDDNKVYLIEL
ncbi:MAG: hypothetical protein UT67_C0001G0028 [Candidatus Magasanikbacteria bacterium GW2011_GWA2_40_10]|uniref:Uncharacterized protein n=1 Tax=Candidatus Magasanikbacteria bacterium GW2011_GWA2_40_10 TaxID=1619037 RepID=A0A0G0Q5U9_9BACT|nr:MAG: hypothetical protein UT67_C0001G0028 [Candidatus Magasanikbacteria bacterium GW2011_GWA2_40_10]